MCMGLRGNAHIGTAVRSPTEMHGPIANALTAASTLDEGLSIDLHLREPMTFQDAVGTEGLRTRNKPGKAHPYYFFTCASFASCCACANGFAMPINTALCHVLPLNVFGGTRCFAALTRQRSASAQSSAQRRNSQREVRPRCVLLF